MHVNKRYLSFYIHVCVVPLKVITWKSSFNRLNEEYGIAKKKKQALDGLFEKGKISQSTHDSFNCEIVAAIAEIEKQQQELARRMQSKTDELQNQIKTLEILLANYEIQYVAGEIDDNTYQVEINLLGSGLDTAKRELNAVQDAVNQLCAPSAPALEIPAPAPAIEAVPEIIAAAPEPVIEAPIAAPVFEEAPVIEQPIATAEIIAAPAEAAPAVVEAAIEQPAEIIVEAPIEQPIETIAEAPVVEVPVVEVATAQEIATPEPVAEMAEEVIEEKLPLDSFEVAAADVVQQDLTQIAEEIMPENPREAPVAAQEDVTVETPHEACVETQQTHLPCAKETLHEAYSDSENKE